MVLGHQRRPVGNAHHPVGFHHRKTATGAGAPDRLTSAKHPRDQDSRGSSQHWGIHVSIYSRAGGRGNREIGLCMKPDLQKPPRQRFPVRVFWSSPFERSSISALPCLIASPFNCLFEAAIPLLAHLVKPRQKLLWIPLNVPLPQSQQDLVRPLPLHRNPSP